MCELSEKICVVYLSVLSILDIRFRKMPVWLLSMGGVLAMAYPIWNVIKGTAISFLLIVTGAAVGIIFLGIGKVTKEAFGYGDGLVILILGIYLGFWNLTIVLMIAFFMASVMALLLLISKRGKRKLAMPFVPFLCIGYAVFVLMGQ